MTFRFHLNACRLNRSCSNWYMHANWVEFIERTVPIGKSHLSKSSSPLLLFLRSIEPVCESRLCGCYRRFVRGRRLVTCLILSLSLSDLLITYAHLHCNRVTHKSSEMPARKYLFIYCTHGREHSSVFFSFPQKRSREFDANFQVQSSLTNSFTSWMESCEEKLSLEIHDWKLWSQNVNRLRYEYVILCS